MCEREKVRERQLRDNCRESGAAPRSLQGPKRITPEKKDLNESAGETLENYVVICGKNRLGHRDSDLHDWQRGGRHVPVTVVQFDPWMEGDRHQSYPDGLCGLRVP